MRRLLALLTIAGCGSAPSPAPSQPAAAVASPTPCFPDRTEPLVALDMYKELEQHAMGWAMPEDERPPPVPYGTCEITNSQVRAADGTLVAELGCGVRILVPGIRDNLGLELGTGARGQDVLDRLGAPTPPFTCWANGPEQTRCRPDRADDSDTDASSYVVAGSVPGDALTGADAVAFFAPRELVELAVSVWCH